MLINRFNGKYPPNNEWREIQGTVVRITSTIVYRFSEYEGPNYLENIMHTLYNWTQTEEGKWIIDNAIYTPIWHQLISPDVFGYDCYISASLKESDITFWRLKWSNVK